MKNNKLIILLIIILLSFVVGLTLIMVNLIYGNKFFKFRFNNKISNEIVFNETFNQSFENININTNASDIFISQINLLFLKITANIIFDKGPAKYINIFIKYDFSSINLYFSLSNFAFIPDKENFNVSILLPKREAIKTCDNS